MTTVQATQSRRSSPASSRLAQGASGAAVQDLQRLLQAAGLYGSRIDGQFGPVTAAAVRQFQQRHGLTVDGWAGPQTLAALRGAQQATTQTASGGRLVRGVTGPAVAHVQQLLQSAGYYRGNVGGTFGAQTESAVRNFQQRHGLTVDGWAGPRTLAALLRVQPQGGGPVQGPTPTAPTGPLGAGVQAALNYGKSVLGAPYAAVNPFRFGEVKWDGGRHQSVNGSGTWWQYPRGTQVFDCSGFVVACFRRAGVDLAAKGLATSGAICANANGFLQNLSREQLRPGDLITYSGHVVIYMGEGKTLESSGSGGVKYGTVDWSRVTSYHRVPV